MHFESIIEFDKDLKKLLKRYCSLNSDLEDVKTILRVKPDERNPFSFRIDNLGINTCVIKIKKITCDSLKGKGVNTGLRLIYAYFEEEKKIIFIELYHKNDKANEDKDRILAYFK
ncbi:hypothetical protein [Pedobacter jeongneungensis]|uniref:hypothetical protein n=1 Tax=Pedobacter jeongneungensis TaxID=947309 RepID=UPI00046A8038|nr:hypothetical protein [Pedobacter jeongneungensis]